MTSDPPDHLDRLGRDLDDAWPRRVKLNEPSRRQSHGMRLAALVAVIVVVLVGVGLVRSSQGPGALARAVAAAGKHPDDVIVHWTSSDYAAGGRQADRQELWGATSPPYGQRSITQDGPDLPRVEQSSQGDTVTKYNPAKNLLYVRTIPGGTLEGTRPSIFGADPARIANLLRTPGAHDTGLTTVDDQHVRRFVIPTGSGSCTYDINPDTAYGVRFACQNPDGAHGLQIWEYLPRTPETTALLSTAAQHPGASIDQAPMTECTTRGQETDPTVPPCVVHTKGG